MQFPELVKKVGLDLAIAIFKEIAGQDFELKMTFVEWHEVIKVIDSRESGRPFQEVRKYLQPRAKTYAEWQVVLTGSHYQWDGELEQKTEVMDRLFAAIASVADCKDFYDVCKHENFVGNHWTSRYELALVEKAIRLCPQTFADWTWVFSFVKYEEDPTKTLCLENMEKTAITFEEWLSIYRDYFCGEELKKRAFQKLVELTR